ncbi:hypothetical protein DID78_00875 [Candidatus Marinamargulisbacteria bacterium SCGC AG-343-D04]|nr:hypothetical protein DID78_00875 [Candidatus Marinamargulisbacteria bacterium SCGC AG-343-D04]
MKITPNTPIYKRPSKTQTPTLQNTLAFIIALLSEANANPCGNEIRMGTCQTSSDFTLRSLTDLDRLYTHIDHEDRSDKKCALHFVQFSMMENDNTNRVAIFASLSEVFQDNYANLTTPCDTLRFQFNSCNLMTILCNEDYENSHGYEVRPAPSNQINFSTITEMPIRHITDEGSTNLSVLSRVANQETPYTYKSNTPTHPSPSPSSSSPPSYSPSLNPSYSPSLNPSSSPSSNSSSSGSLWGITFFITLSLLARIFYPLIMNLINTTENQVFPNIDG